MCVSHSLSLAVGFTFLYCGSSYRTESKNNYKRSGISELAHFYPTHVCCNLFSRNSTIILFLLFKNLAQMVKVHRRCDFWCSWEGHFICCAYLTWSKLSYMSAIEGDYFLKSKQYTNKKNLKKNTHVAKGTYFNGIHNSR